MKELEKKEIQPMSPGTWTLLFMTAVMLAYCLRQVGGATMVTCLVVATVAYCIVPEAKKKR